MDFLRKLWEGWKKVGQAIGDFIARVVLTVFYFTLLLPFGIGVRWLSDPLRLKPGMKVGWVTRTTDSPELDDARRLS